jgi:hypothetical protein
MRFLLAAGICAAAVDACCIRRTSSNTGTHESAAEIAVAAAVPALMLLQLLSVIQAVSRKLKVSARNHTMTRATCCVFGFSIKQLESRRVSAT